MPAATLQCFRNAVQYSHLQISYQQFALLEAKSWSSDSRGAKVPFRPLHTKAALWQENLLLVALRNWHSAGNSYAEQWCWFGRSATFFLNSWTYLIGVKARKTEKLAVWQTMRVCWETVLGSITLKPKNDWKKSLNVLTQQGHLKSWREQSLFLFFFFLIDWMWDAKVYYWTDRSNCIYFIGYRSTIHIGEGITVIATSCSCV